MTSAPSHQSSQRRTAPQPPTWARDFTPVPFDHAKAAALLEQLTNPTTKTTHNPPTRGPTHPPAKKSGVGGIAATACPVAFFSPRSKKHG
jgi:hypothetical protein